MAWDDAAERTEQPTAKRRMEAREQGRIPRSADLTAAVGLLGGLLLLGVLGPNILERLLVLVRDLGGLGRSQLEDLPAWIARTGYATAASVAPFLLLLMGASIVASLLQVGLYFNPARAVPKLSKINPLRGLRTLLSTESLQRLGMGLLKMGIAGTVAWLTFMQQIDPVLAASGTQPPGAFHMGCQLIYTLALRVALVLLVLGLLDYLFQRWRVERSLKMTRQEVKDEMKNMEGDPLVKQRRRQVQHKLALQRMGIDVPRANVVITNPSEYAVALRYVEAEMTAPRVVAKGKDLLALRIRQLAVQHGIPIVQRPPLARALYATVEVGREIPPQFYRAVAEVLAYVYRLTRRAASLPAAG
jgi:flagellar biosynthetic protein FlhB